MSKLTEETVLNRTKASSLLTVKKLNLWGSDYSDVSIVKRMLYVEAISLSKNNISSLADFRFCKKLKELSVRTNLIRDINEICYLQELPLLRSLYLDGNPCAEIDNYRATVLKALPQLTKLDDLKVTEDELNDATQFGKSLVHPESNTFSGSPESPRSPVSNETNHRASDLYEAEDDQELENDLPLDQGNSVPEDNYTDDGPVCLLGGHQVSNSYNYNVDRQNANYEKTSIRQPHQLYRSPESDPNREFEPHRRHSGSSRHYQNSCSDDQIDHYGNRNEDFHQQMQGVEVPHSAYSVNRYSSHEETSRFPSDRYTSSDRQQQNLRSGYNEYEPRGRHMSTSRRYQTSCSDEQNDHYGIRNEDYHQKAQGMEVQQAHTSQSPYGVSRFGTHEDSGRFSSDQHAIPDRQQQNVRMNTNVLTAVLSLIKELDFGSLEVVEMAVRSRLSEINNSLHRK